MRAIGPLVLGSCVLAPFAAAQSIASSLILQVNPSLGVIDGLALVGLTSPRLADDGSVAFVATLADPFDPGVVFPGRVLLRTAGDELVQLFDPGAGPLAASILRIDRLGRVHARTGGPLVGGSIGGVVAAGGPLAAADRYLDGNVAPFPGGVLVDPSFAGRTDARGVTTYVSTASVPIPGAVDDVFDFVGAGEPGLPAAESAVLFRAGLPLPGLDGPMTFLGIEAVTTSDTGSLVVTGRLDDGGAGVDAVAAVFADSPGVFVELLRAGQSLPGVDGALVTIEGFGSPSLGSTPVLQISDDGTVVVTAVIDSPAPGSAAAVLISSDPVSGSRSARIIAQDGVMLPGTTITPSPLRFVDLSENGARVLIEASTTGISTLLTAIADVPEPAGDLEYQDIGGLLTTPTFSVFSFAGFERVQGLLSPDGRVHAEATLIFTSPITGLVSLLSVQAEDGFGRVRVIDTQREFIGVATLLSREREANVNAFGDLLVFRDEGMGSAIPLLRFTLPHPDANRDGVIDTADARVVIDRIGMQSPLGDTNADEALDIFDLLEQLAVPRD